MIAKETLAMHQLGLGIFSMQGFRSSQQRIKNTLDRFSNGKGSTVISNLGKLWDVYLMDIMRTNLSYYCAFSY